MGGAGTLLVKHGRGGSVKTANNEVPYGRWVYVGSTYKASSGKSVSEILRYERVSLS